MTRRMLLVLTGCLAASGCSRPPARLPAEPLVTFAAHRDGGGFVVDRLRTGTSGVLVPRGRLHGDNAPDFVLRVDDEPRAALWIIGRSRVLVRDEASTIAPRRGEVLSEWVDGAIRLTLFARDGGPLRSDAFARRDGRLLSRTPARGGPPADDDFRAALRDVQGTEVGWLRVRSRRVYDAVLPARVDDALAAAAAVALDTEVSWLADHGAPHD